MSNDLDYDLESLEVGITKCEKNVKIFEDAIQQEYTTIREYRRIIAQLQEKKAIENGYKI